MGDQKKYKYSGPVYYFGTYLCRYDSEPTTAVTAERALSNIRYKFCIETKRNPNSKISLDKKFLMEVK